MNGVLWEEVRELAHICQKCGSVHPQGAISCDQARETIDQSVEEFRQRVVAHRDVCNCSNAAEHLRKRDREKQNGQGGIPRWRFDTMVISQRAYYIL